MKASRRKAFTLVEILIVTTIVAVLSAILFSVFVRVREKGRQTTCLSNLRQIGAAIQMYVRDHDSVYPSSPAFYDEALMPYLKDWRVRWCPSNRLQPYPGTSSVALCTNGEFAIGFCLANGKACGFCSFVNGNYEMNTQVLNDAGNTFPFIGPHEAKLLPFSEVILLSENKWIEKPGQGVVNRACTLSVDGNGKPKLYHGFDVYAFVHSGGGNYLFADGHVKWLLPQKAADIDCAVLTKLFPKN